MKNPAEVARGYLTLGKIKTEQTAVRLLLLGMLAGAFIALAGAAATFGNVYVGKVAGAAIFPAGLTMVVLAGSELFTGNCLLIIPLLEREIRLRALLRAWLCAPGGGDLVVPGEGALTWRDAVVTGVSDWDTLFEGGSCAVDFTCYDPVAYGAARSCAGTELEVLGTWPTLPVMTLTAAAGTAVKVADDAGRYVLVERDLSAGDEVVMDFASESVTVDGEGASADVGVGSAFFSLSPGAHVLTFSGCSAHEVAWTERWL